MQLKEQPFPPTLANKLGDVPHVSGLLRRIAQLGCAGEHEALCSLDFHFKEVNNRFKKLGLG